MTSQMTSTSYSDLISENIKWLLENTNDSLERQHIIAILESSEEEYRTKGTVNGK